LKPYLLKEYQNRWYVVGLLVGLNEFRSFGIDRIENIEVLNETFKADHKLNPSQLFENTIGLTYSNNKLEEVILSFTPLQAKYVKSLPLHKSQEIVKETNKEVIVKLKVIPNFELKQKILMLGDQVKVIEPKWFAKDIKKVLKATLKFYGNEK
jgi:predicted DNA-binding transcriptional regulator YafY